MKRHIIHIREEDKILCGRVASEYVRYWIIIYNLIKLKRNQRWCKTCKMLYNSEQTRKEDLLK